MAKGPSGLGLITRWDHHGENGPGASLLSPSLGEQKAGEEEIQGKIWETAALTSGYNLPFL